MTLADGMKLLTIFSPRALNPRQSKTWAFFKTPVLLFLLFLFFLFILSGNEQSNSLQNRNLTHGMLRAVQNLTYALNRSLLNMQQGPVEQAS